MGPGPGSGTGPGPGREPFFVKTMERCLKRVHMARNELISKQVNPYATGSVLNSPRSPKGLERFKKIQNLLLILNPHFLMHTVPIQCTTQLYVILLRM